MSELRFDGKVAIVTGAGGALGKAYALMLASRGCSVVVNDLGVPLNATGSDKSPAQMVVDKIKQMGGKAVANFDSVVDGEKIVQAAIDAFGRIDIVINNAGILRDVSFHKMTNEQWEIIHNVHLFGAYKVTRAAWPYIKDQKYGRIIMTSSAAGVYGNFGQANYSSAKLGLLGLSNTLAKEGEKLNIRCNTIAPLAGSRMTETVLPPDLVQALSPEYVAPVVCYLCHESCPSNGELFELGAGWVSKIRLQRTKGHTFPLSNFSVESVRNEWSKIVDFKQSDYPRTPQDSFAVVVENLKTANSSSPAPSSSSTSSSSPSSSSEFKSVAIFDQLNSIIKSDSKIVREVDAVLVYSINNKKIGKNITFTVDLKNGSGSVYEGTPKTPADTTFTLEDEDFVQMITQQSNPQKLFLEGKIKLKGNIGKAMTFEKALKGRAPKAKL